MGGVAQSGTAGLDTAALANQLKVLANDKRLHLLHFLSEPHYLEEIASELGTARQTAQEHVQRLVEAGLVAKSEGRRDHGPVTEYTSIPQRLFALWESLGRATALRVEPDAQVEMRPMTMPMDDAPQGTEVRQRRLTIVHGLRIGHTAPLTGGGPWLVGRDMHAALNLDYDPYVSARHAEIRSEGDRLVLADLYSSNGTWCDWERVPRGGTVPVVNGSLLQVGRSLLLLRIG